ncbi:hypothetical protein [Micromonospora sp. NPDC048830]|uniref:hypothetical protein n=1 Tax=Micromonospora sp. NPDC048830 TaxID=3364257 RepID=UPI003716E3C5
MPDVGPTAVLPSRPLTVGEVLDSAVLLLRQHARVLIPAGVVLAAAEQLLLYPLRIAAGARPPGFAFRLEQLAPYWLLLAVGAATEAMIVLLLGNPAARAAGAALLGRAARPGELLRPAGARYGATVALALLAGAAMVVLALLGPGWLVGWALLGSVASALVVDRVTAPRAPLRAAALALRAGCRAAAVRLLGYLAWWIVRVGLALGGFYGLRALGVLDLSDPAWAAPVAGILWGAVNAVAYPALACLDAVLHLEGRMRTEGLDIRLSRAPAGRTEPALLAADR